MKNRMVAITLALSLVFSLSACGGEDKKEKASEGNKESEQVEEETDKVESADSDAAEDETKDDYDEYLESKAAEKIEETVLLEHEGLKITALEIKREDYYEKNLVLLLENESDEKYEVEIESWAINDYLQEIEVLNDVAAGKKSRDKVALQYSGIDKIGWIDLQFKIHGERSSFKSDFIRLETSEKDKIEDKELENEIVAFDQNNIKMMTNDKFEGDFSEPRLQYCIENNTDKNIDFYLDDVSANGYMIEIYANHTIPPGKKVLDYMIFDEDSLKESGIESIEELEFIAKARIQDTYDDILETDPITLNFK